MSFEFVLWIVDGSDCTPTKFNAAPIQIKTGQLPEAT